MLTKNTPRPRVRMIGSHSVLTYHAPPMDCSDWPAFGRMRTSEQELYMHLVPAKSENIYGREGERPVSSKHFGHSVHFC